MIKEALQYVVGLQRQPFLYSGEDSRMYCDQDLRPLRAPTPDHVQVNTLQGFVDLIQAGIEGFDKTAVVVHVETHGSVKLLNKGSDKWGRRQCFIHAALPDVQQFAFGQFLEHEKFIIGLQSLFVKSADREYLVKIASTLEAGMATTAQDDGISQQVSVKQGVTLKSTEVLRSLLVLEPYRTFREVEQPGSEFVFRVSGKDPSRVPQCALFEADGGGWKIEAVKNVADWLRAKVDTSIPVIS